MTVGERALEDAVACLRGRHGNAVRDRSRVEQPLPAGVKALGAGAVVAKPDGVVRSAVPVGPRDANAAFLGDDVH